MEVKLYRCETCGNIIIKLVDSIEYGEKSRYIRISHP